MYCLDILCILCAAAGATSLLSILLSCTDMVFGTPVFDMFPLSEVLIV